MVGQFLHVSIGLNSLPGSCVPRGKNNDNCVDKDANEFLLHQSKVWYILNDRINYIFDLQVSHPQGGLDFLKNIIPLMSLPILPEKLAVMKLSREIFELKIVRLEPPRLGLISKR